jgi:hypothetical protein
MYIKYACRECEKIYELNKDAINCHKDKESVSCMVSSCCEYDVSRLGRYLFCDKCGEREGKSNVMKDKLNEIKQLLSQLNNLVYNFNAGYYDERIEFIKDFKIDEEGYNFRVVRVISEENAVEISYDVFEKDDQVKCTDFIAIEQFIKYVK